MDVSGNGAEGKGDDDDYDPLDAFMTDLKAPAVAQVCEVVVGKRSWS